MNKWIKLIIHILIFVDLLFLSAVSEVFAVLFVLYIAYLILLGVKLSIMRLGMLMRGENKKKIVDKKKTEDKKKINKQIKNTKT